MLEHGEDFDTDLEFERWWYNLPDAGSQVEYGRDYFYKHAYAILALKAATEPKAEEQECLGCGRVGRFDGYEIERDPMSGAVQHWDEANQAWCGPVDRRRGGKA